MGDKPQPTSAQFEAGQPDVGIILSASLDSMLLLDPSGLIVDLNPAAEETFGYRKAELLGAHLGQIIVRLEGEENFPEGLDEFSGMADPALYGRRICARGLRSDSSDFAIELGITRANQSGPALFIAQIRDITERESAELSLLRSQRTLANLLSNLPGMAYRSQDAERRAMEFISEGCKGLTGYDAGELLDDPELTYTGLIHPDDCDEAMRQMRESLASRTPFQILYRIRTAEDDERWVLERGQGVFSVFSREDELLAVEGFVFDITERKNAEESRASLLTLQRELDVASTIQQSMLPQVFPERPDCELYAKMIPAKAVGGDFYDFFFRDDGRLGVVIGDVSGKGVPAALFMSIARALVKSTALTGVSSAECLRRVNQLLCEEKLSHLFITLFYAIVDLEHGHVEFCNAGHNPPYHIADGKSPRPLERPSGIVLGVEPEAEYEAGSLELQRGDSLFLYTDGITEARSLSQAFYGDERLEQRLAEAADSCERRVQTLLDDVGEYVRGADQSDDITALAVRLR